MRLADRSGGGRPGSRSLDPALVRPAAKGVGIDADHPAGRSERQPAGSGESGVRHARPRWQGSRRVGRAWGDTLARPVDMAGIRDSYLGESGYRRFAHSGGRIWGAGERCQTRIVAMAAPVDAVAGSRQAGTNSWSSRWMPSHRPQRGRIGRDRDRAHDLADLAAAAEQEALAGHPATDAGRVAVELEGPGLIVGRSVQATGASAATMSRRLIRHGVPSMTSRQPSQRIATLSLTIVRIWTPMISIALDGSRGAAASRSGRGLVPPRGFEPLISTLKGWRPRPLDDGGMGRRRVYQRVSRPAGAGRRPLLGRLATAGTG